MGLKESSLAVLKNGGWSFEIVAPGFEAALMKRVQGRTQHPFDRERTLMEWTLQAYQRNPPNLSERISQVNRIINPYAQSEAVKASLSRLAEEVIADGSAVPFTDLECKKIQDAVSFLAANAPFTKRYFDRWITHFLKIDGGVFRSASSPIAFGCIFLSERILGMTSAELATSITHEMGHQDLFLLNLIDRLVNSSADFKLVHAPFQDRLRPPIGRLHSYFALFRMIQFQDQASLDSARYRKLFFATEKTFSADELTVFGFQLVNALATYVSIKVPTPEVGLL